VRLPCATLTLASLFVLGVPSLVLPRVASATPSLDGCTGVLRLDPASTERIMVDTPGVWCLDGDLVIPAESDLDYLVTVNADDVVIDCRGHRLEMARDDGGARHTYGLTTEPGIGRTIVRNCTFRGFTNAIAVVSWVGDCLIEDNVVEATAPIDGDYAVPISAWGAGTVRRNRVRGARDMGIEARGGFDVLDNVIDRVMGDGEGYFPVRGIVMGGFDSRGEISGNVIRGLDSTFDPPVGVDAGQTAQGQHIVVRDNVVAGDGATGSIAVTSEDVQSTRVSDNVVTGFATLADDNCHDSGGNDVSP
jgi:hypothetical protein